VSKQSPWRADTPEVHGHLVQALRASEDLAKVLDPNLRLPNATKRAAVTVVSDQELAEQAFEVMASASGQVGQAYRLVEDLRQRILGRPTRCQRTPGGACARNSDPPAVPAQMFGPRR